MLVTEWDYELDMEVAKEEAHEAGLAEGRTEGRAETLRKNVNHMFQEGFDVKTIARALGLPEQTVNDILDSQTK
jgi:predicted transposase/invertase (TIGR01784 family)